MGVRTGVAHLLATTNIAPATMTFDASAAYGGTMSRLTSSTTPAIGKMKAIPPKVG